MSDFSWIYWITFISTVCFIVLLDLKVTTKDSKKITSSLKLLSFVLVVATTTAVILYMRDRQYAIDFINGYVVELILSIDNVFVFLIILNHFEIKEEAQNRILSLGVLSALLMRFILITFCTHLVLSFSWIFYVFAILLVYGAYHIISQNTEKTSDVGNSWIFSILEKFVRIDKYSDTNNFFTKNKKGEIAVTKLLIALITIEKADLIFAIDSVPAVLAITREPFIVFSSSILAITGLRSMYIVFVQFFKKSSAIRYGSAAIMVFIAIKMVLEIHGIHIQKLYFFVTVIGILSFSILYQGIVEYFKTCTKE